jgi:nucleotide sugar dehydrogenase
LVKVINLDASKIAEDLKRGEITVGVYGLGRMGLPTACLFSDIGANVIGVDINPVIINQINNGDLPFEETGLREILDKSIASKRFIAITDTRGAAEKSDIIIVIVPTTIDSKMKPDYSAIERAGRDIGFGIQGGNLIILQSTVGPGVTEGLFKEMIEKASGKFAGRNFCLAYSPIRATAGRVLRDITHYPRIVAGIDERSLDLASSTINCIVESDLIKASSVKTAETIKLFENVYRDLNIALANELALICESIGIDFYEAREAANSQPYSHIHRPGIGVGGHCIPFNPYFLMEVAEKTGAKAKLIKASRKINDNMPSHIVKKMMKALRSCDKRVRRSTIAVLGLSYKSNVKEARHSPSINVIELLHEKGIQTRVYDPFFSSEEIDSIGFDGTGSAEMAVENADCVLIAVNHDKFKKLNWRRLTRLMGKPPCVVDGCNLLSRSFAKELGISLTTLGSGS